MKRFFRSLLVLVFGVFLISSINVKATSPLVEAIDGASIRTQGVQGLRFYATLDESVKANEHGFYLVYGKTTIAELEAAITAADGGTITLNDKTVFKVQVPGVIAGNEFSVVLLGIPEAGYFDNVSVIPYVVVDEENVYSATTVSRSVAEVALKMANAGEDISVIQGFDAITSTAKKKVAINADGNLAVSGGVYELNPYNLREEFVKDWNAKFGTTWTSLDPEAFYNSAKTGLTDAIGSNKDLAPSNIYKFFNDAVYKVKWGWVLDYMTYYSIQGGIVHPELQAVAIQGDGTNADKTLYHANHLSYSIANFFNREHEIGGYTAVNFTTGNKYANLGTYNNKVYVDLDNYEFYDVGATIVLPAAIPQVGYNFSHYVVGGANYNAGADYVITTDDVVVEPVYTPIEYTVTFYDGETVLTDLNTTYNIVNGLPSLPAYSKEGYTFLGWYDNALFDGSAITSIPSGSTGHKVYYAKTVEAANAPVPITYNLDGGNFYKYESREAMVADFMLDFNAYFSDRDDIVASEFQAKTFGWNVYTFFTAETYAAKWGWMRTYMIQVATDQSHSSAPHLQSNNDATWRSSIDSFLNETVRTAWPASADYSVEPAKNGFWHLLVNDVAEEYEYATTLVLPIPVKFGSTFAGWYYEVDFSGTVVTQIEEATTETIVLYAKWE
jgi:uncharacterized repeat protein (TIGR02543 family)